MITNIYKAYFLRDFRQNMSYRFSFFLDISSVFVNTTTFYFVAKLIGPSVLSSLDVYGGAYFPFVLIGIAFSTYQTAGLTSFSQSLRAEQYMGTLESILVAPVPVGLFLAGSALWDFFYATIEVAFYFLAGVVAFNLALPNINWETALVSMLLTLTSFMGLGILAAAFILRFKKGNPVTWLLATLGELLGGVYFPTTILPGWLKKISDWIPMSQALQALRKSLLTRASFHEIRYHLVYLFVFSLFAWAVGIGAFWLALKKSKEDGSLGHY
jgi:ABC-2 type transport system permease protein